MMMIGSIFHSMRGEKGELKEKFENVARMRSGQSRSTWMGTLTRTMRRSIGRERVSGCKTWLKNKHSRM